MKITPNQEAKQSKIKQPKSKKQTTGDKKPGILGMLNPKNVEKEVRKYGYEVPKSEIVMAFIVFIMMSIVIAHLFNVTYREEDGGMLHIEYEVALIVIGCLFAPQFIINKYHKKYEDQRFLDVNVYIEQMLYSFSNTRVIYTSLKDCITQFKDSPMQIVLRKAVAHIENTYESDNDVTAEALDMIYKAYPTQKLLTVHKFMQTVEKLGGEFDQTLELLNEDRFSWERRKLKKKQQQRHLLEMVVGAIVITLAICVMFTRSITDTDELLHNETSLLSVVVLWFVDLVCFTRAQKLAATGILEEKDAFNPKDALRRYERIVTYDERLEAKKSLKIAIIPAVMCVVEYARGQEFWAIAFMVGAVLCLYQHRITYNTTKKSAKKEIESTFPNWLMEVALLIQFESVKKALYESIPNSPVSLRPELEKFYEEINAYPHAIEPYINFMHDFDVPQITSAMKMLYAISEGTGGDPDTQIAEIIRKNNEMQDKVEEVKDSDSMANMTLLYMAPAITGGGKLLIDMVIYMIQQFATMGSS